jgi:hypothetical protein
MATSHEFKTEESRMSLGSIVDDLGVTADLRDDEVLTDVVVIGKITKLLVRTSGNDWITSLGMLHAASLVATENLGPEEDD